MYRFQDELKKAYEGSRLSQTDAFYKDPLTGLPNLNYLNQFANETIDGLLADGQIPVLIYVDVIAMQFYNSQYGYQKGNELLRSLGEGLQLFFPDALIMRGADDHFILIDRFESRERTEELILALNERIQKEAEGNSRGIKAGVCVYEDGIQAIDLLDRARNAIKWIGNDLNRVCHFYTHRAEEKYWNQRYIIENFDKALEEAWIRIYYQGIVRTDTGKSTALEALARWVDPMKGILAPKEFIPVLKKHHLLHKLDLFMAEQVCKEMLIRTAKGLPLLPVTVNFSAQDFDYEDIPARLSKIYRRYCRDIPSEKKYLVVEITEQDMAKATDKFQDQLKELREMGFRIWLDDFGSGYSSLNVFGRFEIDLIKFDMEMLKNLDDHNGANRRIMNSMVRIARELGIHTLAEGMETEEQKAFLLEIGCELAQGFLHHKPEPLDVTFFRIKSGQNLKPYETPEEREMRNREWFEQYEQSLAVIEQFGDRMPGGFFICKADNNQELLYANKTVCQIYACDSLEDFKDFSGFTYQGMVHPEDYKWIFLSPSPDKTARSDSDYVEYRIIRKDGQVRWVDEYSYYIYSDLHKGLYYVFITDITEKRQKLEADKAMRSTVIEALTRVYDSVWLITDIEAQRFELYRVDESMAHLLPASEAVKNSRFSDALQYYSKLVLEEDRQRFLAAVTPENIISNTRDKLIYSVPFRRVFGNGVRYYRLEFAHLDLGNGEHNIVAGFKDVDEEIRKEQKIKKDLSLRGAVIEALTRVYDSVWLITDIETQEFELYRVDESKVHMIPAQKASKLERFSDALQYYSKLVLEEDRQRFLAAVAPETIEKNTRDKLIYSVLYRRVFEDGIRYYRLEFSKLDFGYEKVNIVAAFKDVDGDVRKDKALQEALQEAIDLAETDQLTGVYNRITGETKVRSLIEREMPGMFVLFDIDNFKLYNDQFGHNVGDQVIIMVAGCIKKTFRGGDIVMRLGGDEFAAFASGVHSKEIGEKILGRFYDNLDKAAKKEGMKKIEVSAGAAFTSEDTVVDFMKLYESADQCMYQSKKTAGNQVTFCEL